VGAAGEAVVAYALAGVFNDVAAAVPAVNGETAVLGEDLFAGGGVLDFALVGGVDLELGNENGCVGGGNEASE
jgi:hypothetical protein